jgi:AraC-like DNA-binding protein
MGSVTILDVFARGVGAGAMLILAFGFLRDGPSRQARLIIPLACFSIISWLIMESGSLRTASGSPILLEVGDAAAGGLFWLFVQSVFADRRVPPWAWAPTVALVAACLARAFVAQRTEDWLWAGRNLLSGTLCLHAAVIIARGWSGDLLEARRRLRGLVLGFGALLGATNVLFAFVGRLDPGGPWQRFMINAPLGGALFVAIILAGATLFLQVNATVAGAPKRAVMGPDPRGEAAERQVLAKLDEFMAAGAWRREGLTIGQLAEELATPEHRLRRLINQRLGHRNFADFVNGHRIEAAKRRLADPAEARTTVAAIAFDLGYGSLGPFNRAFRAATGLTPTEWRRTQLGGGSPILSEAV